MENDPEQKYSVLGMMSGTSLDGLDLSYCEFTLEDGKWAYDLQHYDTIPYNEEWQDKLANLEGQTALEYTKTDIELGEYMGKRALSFLEENQLNPEFIASHGHTIFHQPDLHLTTQIGNGAVIAAMSARPVICDFRTADMAKGGQGAPFVPVADMLLFPEFKFCLNLGGIANISTDHEGERVAFDICPVNMVLNHLAKQKGLPYDEDGEMARSGHPDQALLKQLDGLKFYQQNGPKSLGKEWVLAEVMPLLEPSNISVEDKACTFVYHIAHQIDKVTSNYINGNGEEGKILVTGGGAYHSFLIETLQNQCVDLEVYLPERKIIEFKEAMAFALLGVLRWRGEINSLKSVTGAKADSCGGAIYLP